MSADPGTRIAVWRLVVIVLAAGTVGYVLGATLAADRWRRAYERLQARTRRYVPRSAFP